MSAKQSSNPVQGNASVGNERGNQSAPYVYGGAMSAPDPTIPQQVYESMLDVLRSRHVAPGNQPVYEDLGGVVLDTRGYAERLATDPKFAKQEVDDLLRTLPSPKVPAGIDAREQKKLAGDTAREVIERAVKAIDHEWQYRTGRTAAMILDDQHQIWTDAAIDACRAVVALRAFLATPTGAVELPCDAALAAERTAREKAERERDEARKMLTDMANLRDLCARNADRLDAERNAAVKERDEARNRVGWTFKGHTAEHWAEEAEYWREMHANDAGEMSKKWQAERTAHDKAAQDCAAAVARAGKAEVERDEARKATDSLRAKLNSEVARGDRYRDSAAAEARALAERDAYRAEAETLRHASASVRSSPEEIGGRAGQWEVVGNTLYTTSKKPAKEHADWFAFPGYAETANRIAAKHNADLAAERTAREKAELAYDAERVAAVQLRKELGQERAAFGRSEAAREQAERERDEARKARDQYRDERDEARMKHETTRQAAPRDQEATCAVPPVSERAKLIYEEMVVHVQARGVQVSAEEWAAHFGALLRAAENEAHRSVQLPPLP